MVWALAGGNNPGGGVDAVTIADMLLLDSQRSDCVFINQDDTCRCTDYHGVALSPQPCLHPAGTPAPALPHVSPHPAAAPHLQLPNQETTATACFTLPPRYNCNDAPDAAAAPDSKPSADATAPPGDPPAPSPADATKPGATAATTADAAAGTAPASAPASAPAAGTAAAAGDSPRNRTTGIVLAHDSNAAAWKGPLLTELSAVLARAGFVVMRPLCSWKEVRRQRLVEKALDTAATSPYACNVDRWILAGGGQGAAVGGRHAGWVALVTVAVAGDVAVCMYSCSSCDHWLLVCCAPAEPR